MAKKTGLSHRNKDIILTHATSTNILKAFPETNALQTEEFVKGTGIESIEDALLLEQVLMRMARKEKAQGSSLSEDQLLEKLALAFIKKGPPEILSFLEETESHHLYFDDMDQLLRVFSWIQKKTEEELGQRDARRQGRRNGRVIKDADFWKNVYTMACPLFKFFEDHWNCFSSEKGMVSFQEARITICTFEIIYKLMSTVPPCKVFCLVKTAHQAGIDLQQIERLALNHVPMRIDDFIQLIADKILTPKTCHLFLNNPELVRALSCKGIRHLFRRWKDSGGKTNILTFAQSIRHELYPDALPDGKNVGLEVSEQASLVSFLNALYRTKPEGPFYFPDHAYAPGLYCPSNALILLPTIMKVASLKEETPSKAQGDNPQQSFCEEVLAGWMERGELHGLLMDDPYLRISQEEQTLSPKSLTVVNPWSDVLSLIKEDIFFQTESSLPVDPDLLVLNQELTNVEILLRLVSLGDTDGVLEQWSSWIDSIREQIKKLDERLKRATILTTVPVPLVEEINAVIVAPEAPVLEVEKTNDSLAQKDLEFPEGEWGILVEEIQGKLKQLPSGAMRRQFKGELDVLTNETRNEEENPSLKARFNKLKAEIQSLLDEISS